jgi:uncharacterized membrane protein YgaE (UPF0421/DUF939 family)
MMKGLPLNASPNHVWTAALVAAFIVAVAFLFLPADAFAQAWQDMDQLGRDAKTSWENWGLTLAVAVAVVIGMLIASRSFGLGLAVIALAIGAGGILAMMP